MSLQKYHRVVIKIGTGVLTGTHGQLDREQLERSVRDISAVVQAGIEVIVVTSGAVATGRSIMSSLQRDFPDRQAYAAIGQPLLMQAYHELMKEYNLNVAQILITREDFDDRTRYLNVRNTLQALLMMKTIPIVNENDVVAVTVEGGDAFGGNDALAAMMALAIDADLLLIVGLTDGLLDAPPESGHAKRIPEIHNISEEIFSVVGKGSPQGRGGMQRKLEAAKLAAEAGIVTMIASGKEADIMKKIIIEGEDHGTRCIPRTHYHSSRDRWLVGGVVQKGSVIIDAKAVEALYRGSSLLPVGICAVEGDFKRGDAVRVLSESGESIAVGLSNYPAADLYRIKRRPSKEFKKILGYHAHDEAIHRYNLALTGCKLTYAHA